MGPGARQRAWPAPCTPSCVRIVSGVRPYPTLQTPDPGGPIPFARYLAQQNAEAPHRPDADRVALTSAPPPVDRTEPAHKERPPTPLRLRRMDPPPALERVYAIRWLPRTGRLIDLMV